MNKEADTPGPGANPPQPARAAMSNAENRKMVLALAGATGLSNLSALAFLPSIFSVAGALDTSTANIQTTIFIYQWLFACTTLFAGTYSDRYNKSKVLILGYSLVLGGGLLAMVTTNFWVFLLARCLQAVGSAIGFVTARAVAVEIIDRSWLVTAMSWIAVTASLASTAAPFFGGLIDETLHWRVTFALLAVCAALVAWHTWRYVLPRTPPGVPLVPGAPRRSLREYFPSFKVIRCSGAVGMNSFAFHMFMTSAPVLLTRLYGYTPAQVGMAMMAQTLGFTVFVPLANAFMRRTRQPIHRLIRTALAMLSLVGLVQATFAWLGLAPGFILAMAFAAGAVNAFVVPIGFASVALLEEGRAGAVSGFLGFTQFFISGIAGVLAVVYSDGTFVAVGLAIAISAAIGVALVPTFPKGLRLNGERGKLAGSVKA